MEIKEDAFGTVNSEQVRRFTMLSPAGAVVQIINYGAAITSLKVPDRNGRLDDIVLGFDSIEEYLGKHNPYFGATIGRVCNRTANGKFQLNGNEYQLSINNGPNHLHGGTHGFDKKMWDAHVTEDKKVVMSYLSSDNEQGYPGNVLVNVTFELTPGNELIIEFQAITSKPTPISLTNHSYFNLAGHKNTEKGLHTHYIQLNANNYTPVDPNLVTTGQIVPVSGTQYDLRVPNKSLGSLLDKFPSGPNGYDNNFCLNKRKGEAFGLVAVVQESSTGRVLVIYSDQPGLQFYTSNFHPDPKNGEEEILIGKDGAKYWKHGSFCLEPQNYPNAINCTNFPNPVLLPGQVYKHTMNYKFFTTVASTMG